MRLSPTFSLYLGRQFLMGIGFVLVIFMALTFLIVVVELLRRASGREAAGGCCSPYSALRLSLLVCSPSPFALVFTPSS